MVSTIIKHLLLNIIFVNHLQKVILCFNVEKLAPESDKKCFRSDIFQNMIILHNRICQGGFIYLKTVYLVSL